MVKEEQENKKVEIVAITNIVCLIRGWARGHLIMPENKNISFSLSNPEYTKYPTVLQINEFVSQKSDLDCLIWNYQKVNSKLQCWKATKKFICSEFVVPKNNKIIIPKLHFWKALSNHFREVLKDFEIQGDFQLRMVKNERVRVTR